MLYATWQCAAGLYCTRGTWVWQIRDKWDASRKERNLVVVKPNMGLLNAINLTVRIVDLQVLDIQFREIRFLDVVILRNE